MDLDSVMKKFDRESNTRVWEGIPRILVNCVLAFFAVFCLYVTLFATWLDEVRLTSFMAFIIFLGILVFPVKKGKQRVNFLPWYDIIIMVLGTAAFLYFTFNAQTIIGQGLKMEDYQVFIGIVGILALAEVCRRCVGLPILLVAGALVVYAFVAGVNVPDLWKKLSHIIHELFYTKNGIFGTPVNACSKFIAIFIIFGAFLERTGIADFFIKIANAFVGRFSGGPAKVAVIASALEGMVSGSSVGNTVGSGAVTIPLMKKAGYKPEFAAAAEASASTGGQIMPPIMGAAAFLMAEIVPDYGYSKIVVCAILPAILYFAGVFITVHLEAKKENLRGLTKDELPRIKPLLKQLYLLCPLVLLVYLVSSGSNSLPFAAALAILAAIVVSLFNKETRLTPKRLFEALAAGGQGIITVASACGIAGIVAGVVTMTGLFDYLKAGIIAFSGSNVIVALFLTMICCIILGMGVPTTANYCIMAATCAPILIEMGIPDIAAHFFVFYFGIVADLTPPVALAAYAGAAIAQANPMKTAITSTKLAIGAFIVPYIFALNPAMLLVNTTVPEVILICVSSLIGMFAVGVATEGWLLHNVPWWQRLISAAGGLLLIYPGWITDAAGLVLVACIVVLQVLTRKNNKVKTA
ncbi:MAG: TRAP transporter fused permease subunit [Clostridia bacterium]|nr:TRAP transporter fused permease subunit [Clostridia bacterium]MBQ7090105.1 TRAP transporter fused permease subunit [Clostridia bacterium]